MTPAQSFRACLGQYAGFAARASRSEFWWFQLPWLAIWAGLVFSLAIVLPSINRNGHLTGDAVILYPFFVGFWLASAVYLVAVIVPTVAVTVRRLHDTGLAGWWALVALAPFGGLVLTILLLLPGTRGPNRFGPDPHAARPPRPVQRR